MMGNNVQLEKVTLEQAKELESVGFLLEYEEIEYEEPWGGFNSYVSDKPILPLLELVAKWLRDEKNIFIEIRTKAFSTTGFIKCSVLDCEKKSERELYWTDFGGRNVCFPDWDTALSAAIDHAIGILRERINEQTA